MDADTLGLAHVLIRARNDVTFPGDDGIRSRKQPNLPPCIIQDTETPDDIWIPEVTAAGMAIIGRDKHIAQRTDEKDVLLASRGRMFALTSKENMNLWGMVEVVASQWRTIEELAENPGPYIYSATRTRCQPIDLF